MRCKWGDLISLEYGKPVSDKEMKSGSVPVFGTNGQIGTTNQPPLCPYPSFVIGRKGAYRGVHFSEKPFSVIDTAFYVKSKTEQLDLKWAYYKFLTYDINGMDSGSAIPSTDRHEIYRISLDLPSLEDQRTAASILSSLDAKIANNKKINHHLEHIVRAVFRHMFVENDEVGGWKVGKLGDVTRNIRRGAKVDAIDPGTSYIGLEHMPRGSIALSEWGQANELVSNKFIFKQGEFLFGKLRPYFHKVGIAPVDGVCSTDILVIVPKSSEWYGFILGHISSIELINYTNATSTGTKMPRTNWSEIENYEVAIPPVKFAKEFNEINCIS